MTDTVGQKPDTSFPAPLWPELDARQMRMIDDLAEGIGLGLLQMMENAGRALALVASERSLGGNPAGRAVVVAVGAGGNGGGALVAARRLATWGADVGVVLLREPADGTAAAHQLSIVRGMGIPVLSDVPARCELILDGMIGYSLRGAPDGRAAQLIKEINIGNRPVLSLDVPSGFDATRGEPSAVCVRADATVTLAAPKRGLSAAQHRAIVGDLYLADISIPPHLYMQLSPPVSMRSFAGDDIVRLAPAHSSDLVAPA
ncbi:MAG: NAD(P)H-hydrate epimerase [Bauldia sp.]